MAVRKDRRVTYTRNTIRETIINLLANNSIVDISVTQLCREADINRNTFYKHFDSPAHVLETLEDEMFDSYIISIKDTTDISEIVLKACECIEQHQKMSTLIFSQAIRSRIIEKTLKALQPQPWSIHKETGEQPESDSDNFYLYTFGKNGTIALIQQWVLNGFKESSADIALLITTLLQSTHKLASPTKMQQL